MPEKCLFNSCVFWAILRLLKLVIPRSRKILKRKVFHNLEVTEELMAEM